MMTKHCERTAKARYDLISLPRSCLIPNAIIWKIDLHYAGIDVCTTSYAKSTPSARSVLLAALSASV